MPTYVHTMFADMDPMYTSIGSGYQDLHNTTREQAGKEASNLALNGWNDAIVTFASAKFQTEGLVNRNTADTTICHPAALAAPLGPTYVDQ